jgi:hypothetical protein
MSSEMITQGFRYIEERAKAAHPDLPHIHPHSLRHYCITQWHKQGLNITSIQQLSGHRSLAMVALYCGLTNKDANNALERVAGITEDDKKPKAFATCPKCHRSNPSDAIVCFSCASPMNVKVVEVVKEKELLGFKKLIALIKEHPEFADVLKDLTGA